MDSVRPLKAPETESRRLSFVSRLRNYLLTGVLALAPTALTLWIFIRLFNWVDNLLGRFLRFPAFDYRRIPGLGLIATLLVLAVVGWVITWLGGWIGGGSVVAVGGEVFAPYLGGGVLLGSAQ